MSIEIIKMIQILLIQLLFIFKYLYVYIHSILIWSTGGQKNGHVYNNIYLDASMHYEQYQTFTITSYRINDIRWFDGIAVHFLLYKYKYMLLCTLYTVVSFYLSASVSTVASRTKMIHRICLLHYIFINE